MKFVSLRFITNPTSFSRSIIVTGFQASTTPEDLIIHFQRKRNGSGDIKSIAVSKRGTAVITFGKHEGETGELAQMLRYEAKKFSIVANDALVDI